MKVQEFIQSLFEIEINAHIAHLQTGSYAQHIALNELYTGIVDLRDRFSESYQGCKGIIKGYSGTLSIKEGIDMSSYLKSLKSSYNEFRGTLNESELQAIIDDILEFIDGIIYKLKFLE